MVRKNSLGVRKLVADQRGNIATLFALVSVGLFGVAALAIDAGQLYVTQTSLQGAADAAALAGVQQLPNTGQARARARLYAEKNLPAGEHGDVLALNDIVIGEWAPDARSFTPGGSLPNAIHVVTRRAQANGNPATTSFAALLGFAEVDITAEAIAVAASPPVCVLALNPSANGAFNVGNGTLKANGCSVQVNSAATGALTGNPGGQMTAESICVTGDYGNKPAYSPQPEACEPRADPLAALDPPAVGACDFPTGVAVPGSSDATLSPGVYCGGITITTTGTVTLSPGLYVIKDGAFSVSSQSKVIGDGVSFYIVGDSEVAITGGGTVTLTAASDGALPGILFYGDRDLPATNEVKLAGGGSVHYEGTVYFPSSNVKLVGDSSLASPSPYAVFIADTFTMNGNGAFVINSDFGMSDVPPPPGLSGSAARLVM